MKHFLLILVALLWCNVGYGASTYKISVLVDDGDIIIYKIKRPSLNMTDKKFQATLYAMWEDALVRCEKSGDQSTTPIMFTVGNNILDADYSDTLYEKYRFYCGGGITDPESCFEPELITVGYIQKTSPYESSYCFL